MQKKWKCACGYIHDGPEAPAKCPKCGAPPERFKALDDGAAGLVEGSRHANTLHCRIVSLGRELEHVCKAGVENNLDPGCQDVFQKVMAHSYEIMKLSMTEMQSHIAKGKWG